MRRSLVFLCQVPRRRKEEKDNKKAELEEARRNEDRALLKKILDEQVLIQLQSVRRDELF